MLLQEELLDIALSKDEYHDDGKDLRQVEAEGLGELQASAFIGLSHELIPAPAVAGAAEQAVDKRTDGKEVVADAEVFEI